MNVTVRVVVATLIATLFALFSTSVVAGNVVSFKTSVQADASNKVESSVKAGFSTVSVYRTPDGRYSLSATDNEVAFTGYAPGTPGTFPARVNEDGSITLPVGKRLLTNPNFMVGNLIYNDLTGQLAPTGMRKLFEVIAPTGDEFGNYRLVGVTTSYVKAEEMVASAPNAFVSQWGWSTVAQAEKLWVVNDNPDGAINDPVLGMTGKYLSFFNLDTLNWSSSQRSDIVVAGRSRSIDFDNSRNTAYIPRGSVSTLQVKSLGPTTLNVAMIPDDRLTALVYEPTGEVFHLTSATYGNRVFVYNPTTNVVWDFIPATGTVPELNTNVDSHVQGAIYGDAFFRVIALNPNRVNGEFPQTRVEVYDIPTRTQRAVYTINKQLANGGGIFGARPQISFDPRSNSLWFATIYDGSLGWLDLNSGVFTNVPILQESGIAVGATDVEVDSAQNKLYVSLARFQAVWQGAGTPWVNGSLAEIDLATKQITRQTSVQVYPWSVAVLPTATGTFVSVTNNARQTDSDGNFGTVSIIEIASFTEVSRMRTQRQPGPMAVDFKD